MLIAQKSSDFIIGTDKFEDLQISSTPQASFYYFYHSKEQRLIKRFILAQSPEVCHVCTVTLIKKPDEHFTPRLHFSVRYRNQPKGFANTRLEHSEESLEVKASVDLGACHKSFWDLISYFKSVKELDIPDESFSLMKRDAAQIVAAIAKRDSTFVKSIITMLSSSTGVTFSEQDVNEILQRKKRLVEFRKALIEKKGEPWWQNFFTQNKWIFGYGLNYVILRLEQPQAHVGGTALNGTGAKIPDYLAATSGNVRFTVLVEIKTPETRLLSGTTPIRSGAWSLGRDLTDALAQIQASVEEWTVHGSTYPKTAVSLAEQNIHTVKPRGIIVVGCLNELKDVSEKLATFELFRQSIHGIEIITFDELYERARFIVEHNA
jgi:hypothetical protein